MVDLKAIDLYLLKLKNGSKIKDNVVIDDADIADYLEEIKHKDEDKFFEYLNSLPVELRAKTFIELPISFQIDLILKYDLDGLVKIIENLDSDDATDLYQICVKTSNDKAQEIFMLLNDITQKNIEKLISYPKDEAGSLMQTELFKVSSTRTVKYAKEKLAKLKKDGMGTVENIFIVDEKSRLIKSIPMDELILEFDDAIFEEILDKYPQTYSVVSHEDIQTVVTLVEKYDLVSLAVVDMMGHLLGRITHDDIVDVMNKQATAQIYNLNKLNADEQLEESFSKTTKTRATWLGINLINATIASMVIGVFEETLQAVVALAVLMPIVANMAGTASAQTMTVIVRQMGIGEITLNNLKPIIKKEVLIAALNGLLFGILSFAMAQIRFDNILISLSISLAMFVSFIFAGLLGSTVPMLLAKAKLDPAVASSVIILTLVDIMGFFSFLSIAKILIPDI